MRGQVKFHGPWENIRAIRRGGRLTGKGQPTGRSAWPKRDNQIPERRWWEEPHRSHLSWFVDVASGLDPLLFTFYGPASFQSSMGGDSEPRW
jgi:hypothetical protein